MQKKEYESPLEVNIPARYLSLLVSYTACSLTYYVFIYYSRDQAKKYKIGRTCGTYR